VLRVILDGARPWDLRQYVSDREAAGEAPWTIPAGGKALSERQIRRYAERAERMLADDNRTQRKRLLRHHVAQRQSLYARAVNKGDERTALAVLHDLAVLQGLYGGELERQLEELRRRVEKLTEASDGDGDGGTIRAAGPGPDGPAAGDGTADTALDPAAPGPGADHPGGAEDAGPVAGHVPPLFG